MNILDKTIKPLLEKGLILFQDYIKILLYKNDSKVFELINFDDDKIYSEPLLYSYFNNKTDLEVELSNVLFGSEKSKYRNIKIKTDPFGKIYLPNIGWFSTSEKNQNLIFSKDLNEFFKNEKKIDFSFEPIVFIKNTKIEILKYQIPLLKQCYYNTQGEIIEVEIENITKKQINNLTKAYHLIKENIPSQYELIEKYASKCVVFNVDTYQRNSFATKQAHGIGFYNAYQEDYDEVFFVDDIAHQTGHVIFNTLLFEPTDYFKINRNTIIETITMPNGDFIENRDLYVIYHALYTYYTSFLCLDGCLSNNVFSHKQKHEALGRIAFYINKCYTDLLLIDNPLKSEEKSKEYFTDNGFEIYAELKNKWYEMYQKYYEKVKHFNMSNQPYNFTYSKFVELNPLNKQEC